VPLNQVLLNLSVINQRKGNQIGWMPVRTARGIFLRWEPMYEKKPLKDLTIASTINTIVQCRVCSGAGRIGNMNFEGVIETKCPKCLGTGKMKSV